MRMLRPKVPAAAILAALMTIGSTAPTASNVQDGRVAGILARLLDPDGGLIVVAHRGCHNPAPRHGLPSAPENSLAALDHCVTIGADVMETDVRRTRDGHLVIMHDDVVDRTTDGHGPIAAKTLAELSSLRLRENEGGADAPLTDERVVTLEEMLAKARGRIVLNLDVKDAIYGEVTALVRRLGASDRVIVKAYAGIGSPPLAELPPYDATPFIAMLSSSDASGTELPAIVARQISGARRPLGFEVPRMSCAALPDLAIAARRAGGRLWANSLWAGYVDGIGGDVDALRDPDAVWGRLYRGGVSMIQTDEPEALRNYVQSLATVTKRPAHRSTRSSMTSNSPAGQCITPGPTQPALVGS